ncbi:PhoX family protein [Candidatus Binatia bacterium]|nr:PhoX family protein [Candidatus Binatia bacterium]
MRQRHLNRRRFLRDGAATTLAFATLLRTTRGRASEMSYVGAPGPHFGPLVPDPKGILDLPKGFSYRVVSRTGEEMSDGLLVPGAPDGMGAFAGPDGKTLVVRNHELGNDTPDLGPYGATNERFARVPAADVYDAGGGTRPALGGTTTFVWDTQAGRLERQFQSLAGTIRNCAGGPTPWGSWISCEEATKDPATGTSQPHGFNFEVPATPDVKHAAPQPLKAMGRFNHEAVAIHPPSGCVYQTEDREDGLLYRFVPNDRTRLAAGGKLQAYKVCACKFGLDVRNWKSRDASPGELIAAEWVDLTDVESPKDDLRVRGAAQGAAPFARGEGMWRGDDGIYFACTNGGPARKGQIFRYLPSPYEGTSRESEEPGNLELFVEPDDAAKLDMGDNLTIAPWGELIVCEDGSGEQFLRHVDANGDVWPFARNALNESELAGAVFSPDGSTLFVNIMKPGITLAVTGPWPARNA